MNKLRSIYENASSPGAYGRVESLYREAKKPRKLKRSDNKWRNGYQKSCPIHYTNPFAKDFLEIRQLYSISMNYGRWICAIRVAYNNSTMVIHLY